jgi:parvulin-like peptidyl-prolyl isomerase
MHRKARGVMLLLVALITCAACASAVGTPIPTQPPTVSSSATSAPGVTGQPTAIPEDIASPTPEPPVAALANGQPIYLADYDQALAQYKADLEEQGVDPDSEEGQEDLAYARSWILNVMIEQSLTEQAAAEAGIVVTDEEVDAYVADLIAEYGGEDAFRTRLAEMGDTYDSAWQKTRSGLIGMAMMQQISEDVPSVTEHVHARHILVDTQQEAQSLLNQLKAGAEFVALSKAYSQDSSTKETGGDLGFFPRGILVAPEVEDVAFSLQPGEISNVVASALGYHIVQVIEHDSAREVSPENLRLLQDQAVQRWIEQLWADAEIERFVETAP